MDNNNPSTLLTFLPLVLISLFMAIPAHLLAKEKGRNVMKWTILALIPIVNIPCFWFFIGAANLKIEKKIDYLIARLDEKK
jgi:hypothetical protein